MSSDYVVECRGLPWETTDASLKEFFGGPGVARVDIERMAGGRLTGDAVVTFNNEASYKDALKKHRDTMGTRYIEVYSKGEAPSKRRNDDRNRDFDRGRDDRDRYRPSRDYRDRGPYGGRDHRREDRGERRSGGSSDGIIRLRGLPFSVNVRDIIDFFQPLRVVRDGVILPELGRMNASGEAYVIFENPESVNLAKNRHMKNIGHRYIEVFDASFNDLSRFCDENGLRLPRVGPSPFVSGPQAYAPQPQNSGPYNGPTVPYRDYHQQSSENYRGLPPPTNLPPRDEPDLQDPFGRPRNGPVSSAAPPTMDYNPRPSYDMYPSAPQQYAPAPLPQHGGYYDSPQGPKQPYDSFPRGPDRRIPDQRDPRDSRDPRDVLQPIPHPADPRYADYGGQGFDSRDHYASNWRGGNNGMAAPVGNGNGGIPPPSSDIYGGGSWASNPMQGGGAPQLGRGDGYGYPGESYAQREGAGAIRRPEYGRVDDYYAKPEPYGYNTRERIEQRPQHFVLRMRGIPYRAEEADVASFFYPIRPDNIELLRDPSGRPSGDARVIFYDRKDYDNALMKDKQYMGERYIEMIPDNGRY